jgi:hypothetical protein
VSVEEREGKTERQVLVLEAGRLFIYIFIIDRMRRHRESLCSGVDQGKDRESHVLLWKWGGYIDGVRGHNERASVYVAASVERERLGITTLTRSEAASFSLFTY